MPRPRHRVALSHVSVVLPLVVVATVTVACQGSSTDDIFAGKTVRFQEPAEAEELNTFETCGMCHEDIYRDWKDSMHAAGWTSPLFQAIYKTWYKDNPDVVDCRTCHAPNSLALNGYGHEPGVTAGNLDHGITCTSCHLGVHGEVLGPRGSDDAPHASVKVDAFGSIQICNSCHGIEGDELLDNMKAEWEETGLETDGITCQSCHMPLGERRLYTGAEPTMVRRHTFQGGHAEDWLEGVVTLSAEVEPDAVVVTVTNQKTGHNFPAGCIWRRVLVRTTFVPDDGSPPQTWEEVYATETRRVLVRNEPEVLRYETPMRPGRLEVRVTYRSVDEERAAKLGKEIQDTFDERPVSHGIYRVEQGASGLVIEEVELVDAPSDPDAYRMPPKLDPWRDRDTGETSQSDETDDAPTHGTTEAPTGESADAPGDAPAQDAHVPPETTTP